MKININPDKEFVSDMRKALKDNNGFCPCSLEKNEDIVVIAYIVISVVD